jgi:acetate kinase
VVREVAGTVPQVAVFDTAFHQSIPEQAFMYALPYSLYERHKVRRYGFHGTSHQFVVNLAAKHLDIAIEEFNCISLHLGNGASCAAIGNGRCLDTSMGMTPLEGLIMGTRSGDIDPAILFYLHRETGMDMGELDQMLNRESGLKGICGENDMRTITEMAEHGDKNKRALLALKMFCYRLKKYIGSYLAVLGRVDCIIFTGGIGENSNIVRRESCQGLQQSGIIIDHDANSHRQEGVIMPIHSHDSPVKVLVIPTNEELAIAIQTVEQISVPEDRRQMTDRGVQSA